jgi:hypothetical protein
MAALEKLKVVDNDTSSRIICLQATVYVLAMVGCLKNVRPTFAQMPNRITNVEFTTVSPTIANTMLCVRFFTLIIFQLTHCILLEFEILETCLSNHR